MMKEPPSATKVPASLKARREMGALAGLCCFFILAVNGAASVVVTSIPAGEQYLGQGTRLFDVNADGVNDLQFNASGPGGFLSVYLTALNGAKLLFKDVSETPLVNLNGYFYDEYAMEIGNDSHAFVISDNPFLSPIYGFYWGAGDYLAYTFQDNGSINAGQFQNTRGHLGFSYQEAGQTHYGWFDLRTSVNSSATFYNYGIETTPGQSIYLGATPEPSRAVLLMMCGIALLLRRRRVALGVG